MKLYGIISVDRMPIVSASSRTAELDGLGALEVLRYSSRRAYGTIDLDGVATRASKWEPSGLVVLPGCKIDARLFKPIIDKMPPDYNECLVVGGNGGAARRYVSEFRFGLTQRTYDIRVIRVETLMKMLGGTRSVPIARNGRIIVGLASYLARESGMLEVVGRIAPQCDEMHVALNGYVGEDLKRVARKLDALENVVYTAYTGDEDLGCQNKFRAIDICDKDDYFLTVDDDLRYPENYVNTMVKNCDLFSGEAVVSCHGTKYACPFDKIDTTAKFAKRAITVGESPEMFRADIVGCGTFCCQPKKIGLDFSAFNATKNTGDDELLAVWAHKVDVPLLVVTHGRRWIGLNEKMNSTTPLTTGGAGRMRLVSLLEKQDGKNEYTEASSEVKSDDRGAIRYHIIIPFYNDADELSRCLASIAAQTFSKERLVVTVVDDCSTDEQAEKAKDECTKHKYVRYIRNKKRSMAGGARNTGLDHDPGSEYTVFIDSDDVLASTQSLAWLDDLISAERNPDVILCGFTFKASGKNRIFRAKSPQEMAGEQCVPPWTRVSKTSLVPRFKENRRMLNDVVHFLRHLDRVTTVCCTDFPFIVYMNDNKESCWHSSTARLSNDAVSAQFAVVPDIMEEKFIHDYAAKRALAQIQTEYSHTLKDTVGKLQFQGFAALMERGA